MSLIVLEGLDRTGKSSVAKLYESRGYEIIHMSAPAKGISSDQYLGEMVDLLTNLSGKDVVLDRSAYGELVWPAVYGRAPLLGEQDFEIIREIEDAQDVVRILMHDPNSEAHWQRCVDNKEPLTKVQFVKARSLYSAMADQYGFERKTLKDFPDAEQPLPANLKSKPTVPNEAASVSAATSSQASDSKSAELNKTKEQLKLERANAINEILSKRIIKGRGSMYDDLEKSVRHFLNGELGKIFGNAVSQPSFSNEEVELLKFFCERLKSKENGT